MEIHLFSNEELSHLKFIRENSPKRIWFEFIQYVFEYENFHSNEFSYQNGDYRKELKAKYKFVALN